MLSVIIPNTDEPTVVQLTYDNLSKELLSVNEGSEIIVASNWLQGLEQAKGDYICFVEPDCLVSSGYFSSNLNLFKKNKYYRKLAMITSCLGVDNWGNRIYGFRLNQVERGDEKLSLSYWAVAPDRKKKGSGLYNVQVGFLPGAIIRRSVLTPESLKAVEGLRIPNLVELSTRFSFFLWDSNRRIMVNPNTTYVSTDKTLEHPPLFDPKVPDRVGAIFEQEQI